MTDKEFDTTKARVQKSLDFWIPVLGLNFQRKLHCEYIREDKKMPTDMHTVAQTFADWEYKHGTIRFYIERLLDSSDEDIDYFVRHELAHVLVNPLSDDKKVKEEEFVVTTIAQVLDWVHSAGAGKLRVNFTKPSRPKEKK